MLSPQRYLQTPCYHERYSPFPHAYNNYYEYKAELFTFPSIIKKQQTISSNNRKKRTEYSITHTFYPSAPERSSHQKRNHLKPIDPYPHTLLGEYKSEATINTS
jgi:hypothetical protein